MLSGTERAVAMSCVTIRNGLDLGVRVHDQLVQVGRADGVQPGVGLVEQQDLRVEHQRPGQAGPLAHAAGDLAGQLLLRPGQAGQLHLLEDDVLDLLLGLLGVLAQRERDVVEQVLRAEQRPVLGQHAEQLAHLVQLALGDAGDVLAVDHHRTLLGLEQADQGLEEHRLAGARRAEHDADLARRQGQADVLPDRLATEPLGEVSTLISTPTAAAPPVLVAVPAVRAARNGPSRDVIV